MIFHHGMMLRSLASRRRLRASLATMMDMLVSLMLTMIARYDGLVLGLRYAFALQLHCRDTTCGDGHDAAFSAVLHVSRVTIIQCIPRYQPPLAYIEDARLRLQPAAGSSPLESRDSASARSVAQGRARVMPIARCRCPRLTPITLPGRAHWRGQALPIYGARPIMPPHYASIRRLLARSIALSSSMFALRRACRCDGFGICRPIMPPPT